MLGRVFGPGAALAEPPPSPALPLPRTALAVRAGHPEHLEAHLERLRAGTLALGLAVHWLPELQADLRGWLAEVVGSGDLTLRLRLEPAAGRLHASLEPLPSAPDPYRLLALPHPLALRRQDPLLPHKGLGGPWHEATLAEVRAGGADDALLLWEDGTAAETAIAAIALEANGSLRLPPQQGRVASLAERLQMPAWAAARGLPLTMGPIRLAELRAGRLWCFNALRGFWPGTLL